MSKQIEIQEHRYRKADLLAVINEDDVYYFLMLGQLHNDMSVLIKQVGAYARAFNDADDDATTNAAFAGEFLSLRVLAGTMREGARLLEGKFGLIFKRFQTGPEVKAEFDAIRAYFKRKDTVLHQLRNNTIFHIDRELFETAFDALAADEPLADFHGVSAHNTIYGSAQTVLSYGTLKFVPQSDPGDAFDALVSEIRQMAARFRRLINGFMLAFVTANLSPPENPPIEVEAYDSAEFAAKVWLSVPKPAI